MPPMIRFLHSADWQLGMTRHFLTPEAQARFSQARIEAIGRIGRIAAEEEAAFVVVAGDVFETNRVESLVVRRALEALGRVPCPVFLLPGNHDPLDAGSVFTSSTFRSAAPGNVVVLADRTPHPVLPGVEVVGAPWTAKRHLEDLVARTCAELPPDPSVTRILVGHGMVHQFNPSAGPDTIDVTAAERAIADHRIAYLALGDRHSTTALGSTGRIHYAGAPEPTDYDEIASGNVLLVEIDAGRCRTEARRTGTWSFARKAFDLDGLGGVEAVGAWLESLPEKERTIVKLSFTGTITLREEARLAEILDHQRDLFAAIERWERHTDLVVRPDEDDFSDLSLAGFAAVAVEQLRAVALGTDDRAATARDALGLLIRLAGPGEVEA